MKIISGNYQANLNLLGKRSRSLGTTSDILQYKDRIKHLL